MLSFMWGMQLGVIDFLAFSGVCKSWRSLALSSRKTFMASTPPMSIDTDHPANNQDSYCYLKDFKGKKFKTILPHSASRTCIGLTCGYLILYGRETHDFWLVNPITRHELHFPHHPLYVGDCRESIKAILVFSDSISGWVFVTLRSSYKASKRNILFCIAGKRGWNHVSSARPLVDLHAFKGKIYTLNIDCCLHELRLDLKWKCKSTLHKISKFHMRDFDYLELVSSGENLYIVNQWSKNQVWKLDFDELKWVLPEKTHGEYAFFLSRSKSSAAIKLESWPGTPADYNIYDYFLDTNKSQQCIFCYGWMWYFPNDCLNVNLFIE